jgi:predicted O-methyltransferase YrrM
MRLGTTLRASATMVTHPLVGIERVRGRQDRKQDRRELAALGVPRSEFYGVVDDWQERLHRALGVSWPCAEAASFDEIWNAIVTDMTEAGLRLGLASYASWNDGDRAYGQALWCTVAHMRPAKVVETGVAHGVTTRIILEGLERNGTGQLWSIDLPATDTALHSEIAVAVPQDLRSGWTYVPGTSRDRLPGLVSQVGQLDLFVHDSLHTKRNLCFELDTAWPALRPGGLAVVDDIDHNTGFPEFTDRVGPAESIAVRHVTGNGLWGIAVKGGAGSGH